MSIWRKQAINHKSAVSWLLVAAILFITVLPARFHFHHQNTENTVTHEHLVDLHLSTNETLQTHEEEGAVTFTLSSLDKKSNPTFSPLALFSILFVLFPLIKSKAGIRQNVIHFRYKHLFYFLSPPLRAPPQL